MSIKQIRRGAIYLPSSDGLQTPMMALTKQASATIEGRTLANLLYLATGKTLWNPKESIAPSVKINGLVSGCVVAPTSTNNDVAVSAGVVNVNGAAVTVSADATTTIVRGATGKYAVSAICVSGAGAVTAVKGTDGDALALAGAYDGAGAKPLVATNLAVIAYVVTLGDAAAVIGAADIFAGESANVAYQIDHLRGGIILSQALEANHTGDVARGVYATFYSVADVLVPVAHIKEGKIVYQKSAPVDVSDNDSAFKKFMDLGIVEWKLSITKHRKDEQFVDSVLDPNSASFIVKAYEDTAETHYWLGVALLTTAGDIQLCKRGPVPEQLEFQGTGELMKVAA